MTNEELVNQVVALCQAAERSGKSPLQIIGALEIGKAVMISKTVTVTAKPAIMPASGLPSLPPPNRG